MDRLFIPSSLLDDLLFPQNFEHAALCFYITAVYYYSKAGSMNYPLTS